MFDRTRAPLAVVGRPGAFWEPLCMSPEEYSDWRQANAESLGRVQRPCVDCPKEWGREQADAGLCNGEWSWLKRSA